MNANGPAIWGGCVTRRSIRADSWYFSQKSVTVQGGYGALFAVMIQILLSITRVAVQFWSELRIYPRLQSWWRALAPSTRGYKLSRSQKFVKVQELNCVQLRVSGCNGHYKFVLSAGAKAKTVTNNLPILSVLACVIIFYHSDIYKQRLEGHFLQSCRRVCELDQYVWTRIQPSQI